MAPKTYFITIARPSPEVDWGFRLAEVAHQRLETALMVQNVSPTSPAYEAGLQPGDIVLGIDNSPITGRPLTFSLACSLVGGAHHSIELQVLRDPALKVKRTIMYTASKTPEPYRAPSVNRGVIPSIAHQDSGVRLPDNNVADFYREKAREQWAITKQTYRSTPLIEPKPKVRRDWPMGCYLRHMEGPGWHDLPKTILVQDAGKVKVLDSATSPSNQNSGPGLVHLQYNSPINLYSTENVNSSLMPGQPARGSTSPYSHPSPAPYGSSGGGGHQSSGSSPQPTFNARQMSQPPPVYQQPISNLQKPLQVDITQSPTYQFLREEQQHHHQQQQHTSAQRGASPLTGQHSPHPPTQSPYMKSLMHVLNVSDH